MGKGLCAADQTFSGGNVSEALPVFTISGAPRTKKTSNRIVRIGRFSKVLPSEAHEEWFRQAMTQAPLICRRLESFGARLPILGDVAVRAVVYRDANRGDLLGYLQALADWMQAPNGRRNGAGIIADDVQVVSWDGSRLEKDAERPRIEVEVRRVGKQMELDERI